MRHDDITFVQSERVGRVIKQPNCPMYPGLEVTELAFEDGWHQWFEVECALDKERVYRAWADTIKNEIR